MNNSTLKKILVPIIIIVIVVLGVVLFKWKINNQSASVLATKSLSAQPVSTGSLSGAFDPSGAVVYPGSENLKCLIGDTTPQIKVISPNGGEVFTAGQQIIVKWSTCNISNISGIQSIRLMQQSGGGFNQIAMLTGATANDGSETVTIPRNVVQNNNYAIHVAATTINNYQASDLSDNLFTVLVTKTPLLLTPIDAQVQGSGNYVNGLPAISANHMFYLKNTSSQPIWVNCSAVSTQYDTSGVIPGGGGDWTCTSSLGSGMSNFKLNPNQEVLLSRSLTTIFSGPISSQVQIRSRIDSIYYGISPTDVALYRQGPLDHPNFNRSLEPLLATPYWSY